jgi:hypothetical protein
MGTIELGQGGNVLVDSMRAAGRAARSQPCRATAAESVPGHESGDRPVGDAEADRMFAFAARAARVGIDKSVVSPVRPVPLLQLSGVFAGPGVARDGPGGAWDAA